MPHTLTISGRAFEVNPRYAAGHVLNENEASALNQTFYENLRNNFATKAKEGADQAAFDEYAQSYQFGVRTGGGSRDPIMVEAMELAREQVRKQIVAHGKKISDFKAAAISDAAEKLLEKRPDIIEVARKRVEEMRSMAADSLDADLLSALEAGSTTEETTEEAPAEETTEAPTRRRRAEAAA